MSVRKPVVRMLKLVLLLPIAVVALVMMLEEVSACACCETYAVVNVASWDRLNIRSRPGAQFDVVGSFAPDARCIVLTEERRGVWVRLPEGGWVHSGYLEYRHGG